jgi:GH35 family endo-1,4-beta-xylanase
MAFLRIVVLSILAGGYLASETVVIPADKARLGGPGAALQGGGWNLWSNGAIGEWFEAERDGEVQVSVTVSGSVCQGVWPIACLWLRTAEGQAPILKPFQVRSKEFKVYTATATVKKGWFAILIDFSNDAQAGGEDRNLFVRELRVTGAKRLDRIPTVRDTCADAIRKHRMGTLRIRTAPNATVTVTMRRHAFGFGTALAWRIWSDRTPADIRKRYLEVVRDNFNHAVHENALKWYHAQRQPGPPDFADAERMLAWCEQHGITMRGHCVYWGIEKFVQPWIKALDDDALRAALEKRGRAVTTQFKGRIREYDLNNEMIHGNYYEKRLGRGITKQMFDWARTGDPGAILYVNDYSVLSGNDGLRYERHIRDLLDQGVPVGGIGCQGHFGARVDGWHVRSTLDRLARFKLPIKITEYDANTADERIKAESLETLYRVCFAHPAVEGILMWGFWEGAHWRPKAALWRRDFTPTPAAETYRRLVYREWWTRYEGKADANGNCDVKAFYGRHLVETAGARKEVDLTRQAGARTVSIGR